VWVTVRLGVIRMAAKFDGWRVSMVLVAVTGLALAGCSQGPSSSGVTAVESSAPALVESDTFSPELPSPSATRTVTPTPSKSPETIRCYYGSEEDEWILLNGSKCSGTLSKKPKKAKPTPRPTPTPVPTLTQPEVETVNCTPGYDPCLPYYGGADYDCKGGSGNGPYYAGRVFVQRGMDIYDLDRDGDGVGCE
jgi:hypothetical protein